MAGVVNADVPYVLTLQAGGGWWRFLHILKVPEATVTIEGGGKSTVVGSDLNPNVTLSHPSVWTQPREPQEPQM